MIDPPPIFFITGGVLDAEERSLDVDIVHLIELFRAYFLDHLADVDAGIVDEDVETSRFILDLLNGPLPVGLQRDVERQESGPGARLAQFCFCRRAGLLVDVGDVNDRALPAERLRDGVADPLGATGYQRSLVA